MLKLTILNKPKELLLKCKTKFPDVILANLQEKEVTPSKEIKEVVADKPYDGLSKVIVDKIPEEYIIPVGTKEIETNGNYDVREYANASVNVPEKYLGTKTITANGTYLASDDNLDGYSSVSVETSGVDINDYFNKQVSNGYSSFSGINRAIKRVPSDITIGKNASYMFYYCSSLLEVPQLNTSNVTNMSYMFSNCSSLLEVPQLDTSNVKNMSYMFQYCSELTTVPFLDTSKVTDTSLMFEYCSKLESVPLFDLSNVTKMTAMFRYCSKLKNIPLFNTSNVTSMSNTFLSSGLIEFPQLNTSNVTDVNQMFYRCLSLVTVPLLDFGKVKGGLSSMFENAISLVNLGGLKDLGKAYLTTQSANYYDYKLNLSSSSKLTHDSLMNVINNLYDIKTAGVQTQQLVLGSTNISKLSAEEIAIATNKGFSVS